MSVNLNGTAATPIETVPHNEIKGQVKDSAYSLQGKISLIESYIKKGISVIITNSEKRAIKPWKEAQSKITPIEQIIEDLKHPAAFGCAFVCGPVSGNLETIDIDSKYDIKGGLAENLFALIKESLPDLYGRLPIIKTPSGGYHIYYRCDFIEGNQKLAERYSTESEKKLDPKVKNFVLIETRGIGGYAITFSTPGYTIIQKNEIPDITQDERETLFNICRSHNQVEPPIQQPRREHYDSNKAYSLTPWEDYNDRTSIDDMISMLLAEGWKVSHHNSAHTYLIRPGKNKGISADIRHDLKLFKCWSTSTIFEAGQAMTAMSLYTHLKHNGDFKAALRDLESLGYGRRVENFERTKSEIVLLKAKGKTNDEIKRSLEHSHNLTPEQAAETLLAFEQEAGPQIEAFWEVHFEKKGGKVSKIVKIKKRALFSFLTMHFGIYLNYYSNDKKYKIIRKTSYTIEEITSEQIKQLIKEYIETLPEVFDNSTTPEDLLEVLMRGATNYFNKDTLEFLDHCEPELLRDTEDAAYFPFRNGIIRITKDSRELLSYEQVGKYVWKNKIIPFDISLPLYDIKSVEYYKFLCCICGNDEVEKMTKEQADKLFYAIALIGYLLHRYKDPARPYAIVLAEETENEEGGGGTGKGIFTKAIAKLINTTPIDGKNFDQENKFTWQRVSLETDLIVIEDAAKRFELEKLYNVITEGIQVEKKFGDEYFIPYEDSPKIAITTNYTIKTPAISDKRRIRVFEFSSFFSDRYTPEDHFGHKLFFGWENQEWNLFYNLMFYCVSSYLTNGLIEPASSDTIKYKQIRNNYTPEFLEWWKEYITGKHLSPALFANLYDDFLSCANLVQTGYNSTRFRRGINESAKLFGFRVEEKRNKEQRSKKDLWLIPENGTG